MSSAPSGNFQIDCPHCRKRLQVPSGMGGKTVKCPSCQGMMKVPAMAVAEQPVMLTPDVVPSQPAESPPAPQEDPFPSFNVASESMTERAHRSAAADEGGAGVFAPEKKGLDAGIVGGLLMMVVAAIWFFVGLAGDVVFIYPPILFIIGLIGFFKGLATGNVAGKRRRRRRY